MSIRTRRFGGVTIVCALGAGACALGLSAAGSAGAADQTSDTTSFRYKATVVESLQFGNADDCVQDDVFGSEAGTVLDFGEVIPGASRWVTLRSCVTASVGNGFSVVATNVRPAENRDCSNPDACVVKGRLGDTASELSVQGPNDADVVGLAEAAGHAVFQTTDPAYQRTYAIDTSFGIGPGPDDAPGEYLDGEIALTAIAN